jgi:hypothetical protein
MTILVYFYSCVHDRNSQDAEELVKIAAAINEQRMKSKVYEFLRFL